MMRVAIVYFSGTGNTRIVAELLASVFREEEKVDLYNVEEILRKKRVFCPDDYDCLGLGYPIYGFNPPHNIPKLVKDFFPGKNRRVFLFSTCAGPFYLNDIASYGLKRDLERIGCSLVYEKQFYMPANVAIPYPDSLVRQLYQAAVRKTRLMVGEIRKGTVRVRNDGILPLLFRWTYILLEKISWFTVPLDFKVSEKCNRCLICVKNCPQGNIRLERNRIRFGVDCLACYRCVYACPQKAIGARFYGIAILKKGYDIRKILEVKDGPSEFVTAQTRGMFGMLYAYLNDEEEKSAVQRRFSKGKQG